MPDVFEVLARDHTEVKEMLDRLERDKPGHGGDAERFTQRKRLVDQLITEESKHEALEEMHWWPAVRAKLENGDELAGQATAQEDKAKKVLGKLSKLDARDAEFEKLLAEFTKSGLEHIEFEETQVWPHMRKALSKQEATEMGKKITDGKATAPTRPRADVPQQRASQKAGAKSGARSGGKGGGRRGKSGDTSEMTRAELYEEAKRLGVQGRSSMTKEELAREVSAQR